MKRKLKNYLNPIFLCGQERGIANKKEPKKPQTNKTTNYNKLVQASDFELHMFFEY